MESLAEARWIDTRLKEWDMTTTDSLDLYALALRSDAMTLMQRVGFDDRVGRKRIFDLIDGCYEIDLMVVVQLVRWYEIGLVQPGEIDVPHPAMLMIDLRRRIAASPDAYKPSFIMEGTIERMIAWWTANTITSSWRSVKAHVRVVDEPVDTLCDALADFLWAVRDMVPTKENKSVQTEEVTV